MINHMVTVPSTCYYMNYAGAYHGQINPEIVEIVLRCIKVSILLIFQSY